MTQASLPYSSRVLVTGATGFVGGHLTDYLLNSRCFVTILARKTSNRAKIESFKERGARVIYGDVTDYQSVLEASQGARYVFHLAALFREAKYPDSYYYDVNVDGTRNVLEAALQNRAQRVVHCSTNGVHGTIEHPPGNEESPFHPCDVYQESKVAAEEMVLSYVREHGADVAMLRPAMIWGQGDTRILKLFKGIARRRMPIIGSGRVLTHWIYVHDLVQAFIRAAITPNIAGEAFLIAGKEAVTLEHTYKTIAQLANTSVLPIKIPALPLQILGTIVETVCKPFDIEPPLYRRRCDFFIKNRAFDITKARQVLGFEPLLSFEEEAQQIYTWYKENGWL